MALPWLLVANPPGPRVAGFQRALAAEGLPPAEVVPFLDVIRDPALLSRRRDEPYLLRLDLAGAADPAVNRALLARGYDDACARDVDRVAPAELEARPYERGRIVCPRQRHLGFLRVLDEIGAAVAAHRRWIALNPVDDVALLFDKRLTSRRYAALGIAVPPPLDVDGVRAGGELVAWLEARGLDGAYVKLSCGSTGECLAIVQRGRRGWELITTIEQAAGGWYNTRRPRRLPGGRRFDEIAGWLLREGAQVEAAIDKARLGGHWFDLRVVVVDGEVVLRVIRSNRLPITNLHLGGQRGDAAAFARLVPEAMRQAADESCRRVFAAHRSLQLGIDVLFDRAHLSPFVVEANAFGDNLTREGLGVYRAQIRAAQRRYDQELCG